jgi:hypothetical protein
MIASMENFESCCLYMTHWQALSDNLNIITSNMYKKVNWEGTSIQKLGDSRQLEYVRTNLKMQIMACCGAAVAHYLAGYMDLI